MADIAITLFLSLSLSLSLSFLETKALKIWPLKRRTPIGRRFTTPTKQAIHARWTDAGRCRSEMANEPRMEKEEDRERLRKRQREREREKRDAEFVVWTPKWLQRANVILTEGCDGSGRSENAT